jgi:hypothetical protein
MICATFSDLHPAGLVRANAKQIERTRLGGKVIRQVCGTVLFTPERCLSRRCLPATIRRSMIDGEV